MVKTAVPGKNRPNPPHARRNTSPGGAPEQICFWGLAAILFVSPFLRGLYFPAEQYKVIFFAAVVFGIACYWWVGKGKTPFFAGPLDYLVLALPVLYLASAINPANTGTAVDEVLKAALYFMVYWIASRLAINSKTARSLLLVVYLSAVGVSVTGFLAAAGLLEIKDSFLHNRIASTFQYPNALAGFLIASLFAGLYLRHGDGRDISLRDAAGGQRQAVTGSGASGFLYSLGAYIIAAAMIGTRSNGGLLVLIFLTGIYFLGIKGSGRLKLLAHLAAILLPAAGAALLFLSGASSGGGAAALLWILAGAAAALGLQYALDRAGRAGLWELLWERRRLLALALLAVLFIAGAIAFYYAASHSEAINAVLAEIRLRNATERFHFYSDALRMAADRPLLGWGGGGWQEAYRSYQGYLYNSTQVHSYYLQVLVETGAPGLLAVLAVWSVFLYTGHCLFHRLLKDPGDKFLIWTVTIAALAIGGHAAIDFSLSLSALAMALCVLWGVGAGLAYGLREAPERAAGNAKKYISLAAAAAACALLLFASSRFSYATGSLAAAGSALERGDAQEAVSLLESGARLNPFKAEFNMYLARLYEQRGDLPAALEQAGQALDKAGYTSAHHAHLANLYLKSGRPDKAVDHAEKALANSPYQAEWYEYAARTYFTAGYELMAQGKKQEAGRYLAGAAALEDSIGRRVAGLTALEKSLWNVAPMLAPTPKIYFYSGASLCLAGEYQRAGEKLQSALADPDSKGEALLWLSLVNEKQGNIAAASRYREQAGQLVENFDQLYRRHSQILSGR